MTTTTTTKAINKPCNRKESLASSDKGADKTLNLKTTCGKNTHMHVLLNGVGQSNMPYSFVDSEDHHWEKGRQKS